MGIHNAWTHPLGKPCLLKWISHILFWYKCWWKPKRHAQLPAKAPKVFPKLFAFPFFMEICQSHLVARRLQLFRGTRERVLLQGSLSSWGPWGMVQQSALADLKWQRAGEESGNWPRRSLERAPPERPLAVTCSSVSAALQSPMILITNDFDRRDFNNFF